MILFIQDKVDPEEIFERHDHIGRGSFGVSFIKKKKAFKRSRNFFLLLGSLQGYQQKVIECCRNKDNRFGKGRG